MLGWARGPARPFLIAAFLMASLIAAGFALKTTVRLVQWVRYAEEPIQPWMTVGFVAHVRDVDPRRLAAALGLPDDRRDRRTLAEIAAAEGRPVTEMTAKVEQAVAAVRAEPSP